MLVSRRAGRDRASCRGTLASATWRDLISLLPRHLFSFVLLQNIWKMFILCRMILASCKPPPPHAARPRGAHSSPTLLLSSPRNEIPFLSCSPLPWPRWLLLFPNPFVRLLPSIPRASPLFLPFLTPGRRSCYCCKGTTVLRRLRCHESSEASTLTTACHGRRSC